MCRTRSASECVSILVRRLPPLHLSASADTDFATSRAGHTFAAGYDLRTRETYEKTMDEFERIVGFKYLKGMHLNDSQGGGLACHKDRHENIGL